MDGDLAASAQGERFGEERGLRRLDIDEDQRRRLAPVIELRKEGVENVGGLFLPVVFREESVVAPVLTGAEEEDLDAGLPALGVDREL